MLKKLGKTTIFGKCAQIIIFLHRNTKIFLYYSNNDCPTQYRMLLQLVTNISPTIVTNVFLYCNKNFPKYSNKHFPIQTSIVVTNIFLYCSKSSSRLISPYPAGQHNSSCWISVQSNILMEMIFDYFIQNCDFTIFYHLSEEQRDWGEAKLIFCL